MSWYGVVTNVGKVAIEEHLIAGTGLNLDLVKTGTGTVPLANMRAVTDMVSPVDVGSVIGKTETNNGVQVQISVGASENRYMMKEIGLFANIGDSHVLIAYYNDDGNGVEIPDDEDFPDFNFVLFCLLDIINSEDLDITIDPSASLVKYDIVNDLNTGSSTEGKVLDARQGKVLNDKIDDNTQAIESNTQAIESNTQDIEENRQAIAEIINIVYPIGSIYMSVTDTSPSVLFGGTWQRLEDRFLIGAGSNHSAGATGGAESVSYTPAGSVENHKLTTSEIPSHSHGLNSHKHSIGAHAHGLNSHTHGVGSYATENGGNHTHNRIFDGTNTYSLTASGFGGSGSGTTLRVGTSTIKITNDGSVAHKHTITGSSGAASGNTANSTAFDSGAASGNTENSGGGGNHNHGFSGTSANISTMSPYLAVYMWKRTA